MGYLIFPRQLSFQPEPSSEASLQDEFLMQNFMASLLQPDRIALLSFEISCSAEQSKDWGHSTSVRINPHTTACVRSDFPKGRPKGVGRKESKLGSIWDVMHIAWAQTQHTLEILCDSVYF